MVNKELFLPPQPTQTKAYLSLVSEQPKQASLSKTLSSAICFPHSSVGKESACNAGDPGLIPGLGIPLEKEMTAHSSILTWRIPWTEKPCRLQSMGSQRIGQNRVIKCAFSVHFISLLLTQIYRFLFSSPAKPQHKMKDSNNLLRLPVRVTSSLLF